MNKSVIISDKDLNIQDDKLNDVLNNSLNISDNELLKVNNILEEGIKIPENKLNINKILNQQK